MKMRLVKVWLIAFLLIAGMSACGASDSASSGQPDGEDVIGAQSEKSQTNEDETTQDNQTGTEVVVEGSADNIGGLFIPVPNDMAITQTTPEGDNGEYPLFAWEPVDGVASYLVMVFREEGRAYWSWEGSDTRVILGGFDSPPQVEVGGPFLLEPMQWAVIALDADDRFIASSPLRLVAP